ncbi:filamentous hemagglutinin N-terminal domain-containing protein [filamentous cyanobacterium LEGE 11480]|uniref:Filamentous hemagglutinin N-terminal domain-containing protein n=1 Tax=Romeriopsis navalis LEGE 11480 TaxID=2777977 RepID=A0A928VQY6_9CYAN|nr:filamentous hemagglutinin N-terminal domain-containing protein [Romeriopsis navalis LEGE 11480]
MCRSWTIGFSVCVLSLIGQSPIYAQVLPDATLGLERSIVTPQATQDRITGGAIRGSSLFHSFQDFNVSAGQTLRFAPSPSIANIFSRVTGNNLSNIQGTLSVLGNANLFLLNPNGILFGPNAQLDLTGSFSASTANSFRFGAAEFSATIPNAAPLLTISVPTGMQYGTNAPDRTIQNQANLTLAPQQQLTFDAGTVTQSGTITIPNGTVELRGQNLQLTGDIDTRTPDNRFGLLRLISPTDLTIQSTANLTNQALTQALENNAVIVQATGDLSLIGALSSTSNAPLTLSATENLSLLAANNGNLELAGNLTLQSGGNQLLQHFLIVNNPQVDPRVTLQAGGDVLLRGDATLILGDGYSRLRLTGDRGIVSIQANSLNLQEADIGTDAASGSIQGPRIDVNVQQDVILQRGSIFTTAGDAQTTGGIRLGIGGSLQLLDSASITSSSRPNTNNTASTGVITVQAADTILLRPNSDQENLIKTETAGDAGDILLAARNIILDGTEGTPLIATNTSIGSVGNAGNITLNAIEAIELTGNRPGAFNFPAQESISLNRIISETFGRTTVHASSFGAGASGKIQVNAARLRLRDGSLIANVSGLFPDNNNTGTVGDIAINANDIQLSGLALIASGTVGQSDSGNIDIQSDRLSLTDGAGIGVTTVGVDATVKSGNAGELTINTQTLSVTNGSIISASSEDGGAGGLLDIRAQSVTVDGADSNGFSSGLLTSASSAAKGAGGTLLLQTDTLQVLNGGQIRASTSGPQDAGNITITAGEVTVSGTTLKQEPSTLEAQSTGSGAAGTLRLTADRLTISNRAQSTTQSSQGDGGNITLVLRDVLFLKQQGRISSTAGSAGAGGDGGNIDITAGFIIASPQANSDITANAFDGQGGNITLKTNALLGIRPQSQLTNQSDINASSTLGIDGTINLDLLAPDPTSGLTALPVQLLNPNQQISTVCNSLAASRFILSGRGGIPTDPRQQIASSSIMQDWRRTSSTPPRASLASPDSPNPSPVEAQSWRKNAQGNIEFIAGAVIPTPKPSCQNLVGGTS